MAKNRKKKSGSAHRKPNVPVKHSKTYFETCHATTRRILQAIGEEPSLFDLYTKHQKQDLFRLMALPPRILAMQGHTVPKQYLRYVQESLMTNLRQTYFHEETKVTWMEIVTVGQTLLLMSMADPFLILLSPSQRETMKRLNKIFENIYFEMEKMIAATIKISLMTLSQPNFRIYGQSRLEMMPVNSDRFLQAIYIRVHESRSIRFKYHNRERTAFRIALGQFLSVPYMGATIAMSQIYPEIEHDRQLNIYIQSHAIHRFKERIDTIYPIMRNNFFCLSLMMVQQVVRGPDGTQLITCVTSTENGVKTIGYFVFTIDGNNLFVLTLLPLLGQDSPEGRILYKRLHLSTADLKYLGMDKLSFFYEVDIEQIPVLKRVLFDELHLDYVRTLYHSFREPDTPFDEKKTLFVKNFFEKLEIQSAADHASILDELIKSENELSE
ncbi:MAG: hypothetical protein LBS16_01080 [Prevotellaceae bacterium]|jgi:hypothetical protein|nr:hypothetical protein [Prevotellaceae bacterium]